MSLFVQHLLLLPTVLTAAVLTIVLPTWKITTFLGGVAFGAALNVTFWGGSVVVYTWLLAAFLIVAAFNVIITAAGSPDRRHNLS